MSEALDPFETYCTYVALKNHFTEKSYDYFKYNGKTRVSKETFETRKDRSYFQKLAKKYDSEQIEDFYIANLIHGRTWIGDFLDADAEKVYQAYMERKNAINDVIVDQLEEALADLEPKELFAAELGEYPPILLKTMDGTICHETLIAVNKFVDFAKKFDEVYGPDDMVWGKIRFTCQKLKPFIKFDKVALKDELSRVLLRSHTTAN